MPLPIAVGAAVKSIAKRLITKMAVNAATSKPKKGPNPLAIGLVSFTVLVVLAVYSVISAPLALWDMATSFIADAFSGNESSDCGSLDDMPDEQMVKWYYNKAHDLEDYAKKNWSSNTGEDVYSLPDWYYLAALDTAISENNFDLVKSRSEYYDDLHHGLLISRSSVKYHYVDADEKTEGATYSEEDQKWYVVEAYTIWSVSYKPLQSVFKKSASGELSSDFRYFAEYECGEYGAGWGDQGNALGYYQFDRRYTLGPFLDYCIAQDPLKYSVFELWSGGVDIIAGDSALELAWMKAYDADPDGFAALQDRYEYNEKYVPAEEYLSTKGVDVSGRSDVIKGLICGIYNLFGSGGWQKFTEGLNDSLSDEDFAKLLCNNIIENTDGYEYAQSYQNRYRSELQTVLSLLANSHSDDSKDTVVNVGTDPSAEGSLFDRGIKGTLAENYRRALSSIKVAEGMFGSLEVKYNHDQFIEAITKATIDGKRASSSNSDVVNAAMRKLGCPYIWGAEGPDSFDCSGLVTWAYGQVGIIVPHYTGDQYARCSIVEEADACPGDLVFQLFGGGTNAQEGVPGHVGIYIGSGQMIHAPTFGASVRVDDVRVFDQNPVFGRVN